MPSLVTGRQGGLQKSYLSPVGKGFLCGKSFLGTQIGKGVWGGGCLNLGCFPGAQGSGKVQHCQG